MKSKTEKKLDRVRKDVKAYLSLLDSNENISIYGCAQNHGVRLSNEFVEACVPLYERLKKFTEEI
jgi:hypothetical protein